MIPVRSIKYTRGNTTVLLKASLFLLALGNIASETALNRNELFHSTNSLSTHSHSFPFTSIHFRLCHTPIRHVVRKHSHDLTLQRILESRRRSLSNLNLRKSRNPIQCPALVVP